MGPKPDEEVPRGDTAADKTAAEIEAKRIEDKIDRDLRDSFPASDPPGWTMGTRKRPTGKDE